MTAKFGIACTQAEAKRSGVFISVCKSEKQARDEDISYRKAAEFSGMPGTVRHFYEPKRGYHFYWFPADTEVISDAGTQVLAQKL